MGSACCCEGILTGTKADQVHDHGDQAAPIVPKATDAAKALVETAMSMLAWERSKLSQKEDAVRRYILMKYPLLGLAPSFQEIGEALGLTLKDVQTILEHLDKLDILVLDPELGKERQASTPPQA